MNDERPIEKLLRRYAKKRGDEAGPAPELHPATRRLLQGEVARQFPKPGAEGKASGVGFFTLLARRWVYAVGVFVVLCVAAVMILPNLTKPKEAMLAQNSPSEEMSKLESLPAPVASAPAVATETQIEPKRISASSGNLAVTRDEKVRLDSYTVTNGAADISLAGFAESKKDADARRKLEESASATFAARPNSTPPAPAPMAAPPSTRTAGETVTVGTLALNDIAKPADYADRRQAAPAGAPLAYRLATDKEFLARGGGVEKDAARVYSQSFTSVASDQLKVKAAKAAALVPATPVLTKFQIEQTGNQLRVIDSDGSTYLGELNATSAKFAGGGGGGAVGKEQAASYFKNADQLTTQSPASAAPLAKQQALNYQWRVEGTNRTLNQNVVFTWNFVETNSLAASQLPSGATQLPVQFPAQLQNSLIYGRAQLGAGREIEVNAVPVKP